jgi:hypothetical protein
MSVFTCLIILYLGLLSSVNFAPFVQLKLIKLNFKL